MVNHPNRKRTVQAAISEGAAQRLVMEAAYAYTEALATFKTAPANVSNAASKALRNAANVLMQAASKLPAEALSLEEQIREERIRIRKSWDDQDRRMVSFVDRSVPLDGQV